mmetsp:Transcript_6228/g.4697  ORF Transcript_6228/g.4697 Transcript_6228/m.4697 type:complete len:111 (+) Transcript_6228:873-1205(+)
MWGMGQCTSLDGVEYLGEWLQGFMHGRGILKYHHNKTYTGDFFKGVKEGLGLMEVGSHYKHFGSFDKGFRHGRGIVEKHEGEEEYGEWKRGRKITHWDRQEVDIFLGMVN